MDVFIESAVGKEKWNLPFAIILKMKDKHPQPSDMQMLSKKPLAPN
jgi:hypothetical protein